MGLYDINLNSSEDKNSIFHFDVLKRGLLILNFAASVTERERMIRIRRWLNENDSILHDTGASSQNHTRVFFL
jgi:hypothetical protein